MAVKSERLEHYSVRHRFIEDEVVLEVAYASLPQARELRVPHLDRCSPERLRRDFIAAFVCSVHEARSNLSGCVLVEEDIVRDPVFATPFAQEHAAYHRSCFRTSAFAIASSRRASHAQGESSHSALRSPPKQLRLEFFFGLSPLIGANQFANILARAAIAPSFDLAIDEA